MTSNSKTRTHNPRRSHWSRKFACAFRGVTVGVWGQTSFYVHIIAATFVIGLAAFFRVDTWEWCVLTLCIALVMTAELFNSALEHLAKATTGENNDQIRNALDIASGAVLVASLGAVVVGVVVFAREIISSLGI